MVVLSQGIFPTVSIYNELTDLEIVKLLLKYGMIFNQYYANFIIENNQLDILQLLADKGLFPNKKSINHAVI